MGDAVKNGFTEVYKNLIRYENKLLNHQNNYNM